MKKAINSLSWVSLFTSFGWFLSKPHPEPAVAMLASLCGLMGTIDLNVSTKRLLGKWEFNTEFDAGRAIVTAIFSAGHRFDAIYEIRSGKISDPNTVIMYIHFSGEFFIKKDTIYFNYNIAETIHNTGYSEKDTERVTREIIINCSEELKVITNNKFIVKTEKGKTLQYNRLLQPYEPSFVRRFLKR